MAVDQKLRLPLEFEAELADHYPITTARSIAHSLADKDTPRIRLIGLTAECDAAVYWDSMMYNLLRFPIQEHGLDGLHRQQIATIETSTELVEWLNGIRESYFVWTAPAYR